MRVESDEFAVDLITSRQLSLVVRLERNHIKPVTPDDDGPRILRSDGEMPLNLACRYINHSDLVF